MYVRSVHKQSISTSIRRALIQKMGEIFYFFMTHETPGNTANRTEGGERSSLVGVESGSHGNERGASAPWDRQVSAVPWVEVDQEAMQRMYTEGRSTHTEGQTKHKTERQDMIGERFGELTSPVIVSCVLQNTPQHTRTFQKWRTFGRLSAASAAISQQRGLHLIPLQDRNIPYTTTTTITAT